MRSSYEWATAKIGQFLQYLNVKLKFEGFADEENEKNDFMMTDADYFRTG